jgi:hypothetical protein
MSCAVNYYNAGVVNPSRRIGSRVGRFWDLDFWYEPNHVGQSEPLNTFSRIAISLINTMFELL